jgi:Ribbon-helix-helix protein, copG family
VRGARCACTAFDYAACLTSRLAHRAQHSRSAAPPPLGEGVPITDELVDKLPKEAEARYDVDEMLHRRVGRPPIGSSAASVESVRLDPELQKALAERVKRDHETISSVIRKALRKYLDVACSTPRTASASRSTKR